MEPALEYEPNARGYDSSGHECVVVRTVIRLWLLPPGMVDLDALREQVVRQGSPIMPLSQAVLSPAA